MLTPSRSPARCGFTLIEMLVTIGVITLLAAILIVTIGRSGEKAREAATIALIKKISGQVQERLEAFDRLKSQDQFKRLAISRAETNSYLAPPLSPEQQRIIGFKILMRELFPQRFEDLPGGTGGTEYAEQFSSSTPQFPYNQSAASMNDPSKETESSELLYYALIRGKALGIPTADPSEYKPTEVADTDGDGLLEFIDGWGKPLRFYRWPTRLIRPDGTNIDRTQGASILMLGLPAAATPDPLAKDQDDPTLLLSTVSTFTEAAFHTPQTHHAFLIVSSGPDGQKRSGDAAFGLYNPTVATDGYLARPLGTTGFDALTDNITNRNRP